MFFTKEFRVHRRNSQCSRTCNRLPPVAPPGGGQELWFPINARSSSIIDRPRSANGVFPVHKRDRWAEIKFPSREGSALAKGKIARERKRTGKERENLVARARARSRLPLLLFIFRALIYAPHCNWLSSRGTRKWGPDGCVPTRIMWGFHIGGGMSRTNGGGWSCDGKAAPYLASARAVAQMKLCLYAQIHSFQRRCVSLPPILLIAYCTFNRSSLSLSAPCRD